MSSESFSKLKALLADKGTLTPDDVESISKEHGALTEKEKFELEALKLKQGKSERQEVSMEAYLEATKVLDSAEEGSEEYKKAEAIVNAFESGG